MWTARLSLETFWASRGAPGGVRVRVTGQLMHGLAERRSMPPASNFLDTATVVAERKR